MECIQQKYIIINLNDFGWYWLILQKFGEVVMIFFDNFLKQTSFSTRQGIFDFLLPCINSFINFYPLLTITKLDFTSSCLQHKSNGYLSYFLNTIHIEHSCRFGNSLEASTTINNYTHDIQWFLNIRKNLYLTEQKIFGFP